MPNVSESVKFQSSLHNYKFDIQKQKKTTNCSDIKQLTL